MPSPAGMTILPQYQGSYYDLQRQQLLAQAMMQQALQQQAPTQTVGSGGSQNYQVMPKYSLGAGLSQIGQALLSAKMAQQAGQGLNNLGAQQWNSLMPMMGGQAQGGAAAQSPQPYPGSAAGGVGANAVNGSAGGNGNTVSAPVANGSPGASGISNGVNAPLNPLGMNPSMAAMSYFADPAKFFETQAQAYKPTDATLMASQAGMDPRAANAGALYKNNSLTVRPGGAIVNNGQITTLPASAPEGFQNVQDPVSHQWYTVPVQGGTAALTASNAAGAIGKAYGTTTTGYQNGQPVFLNQGVLAAGTAGGMGAPGGAPGAGPFSGYQSPNGAMPAPSLPPGASDIATGSAQSFNGLRQQAATTPNAIDAYNRAEQSLLSGVTTGPGSTLGTNIIGRLNTAGIPIMKGDATGYQSLQKFLSNAAAQAASAGGFNGSDARFEAFSHGQPNAETMNPDALRYAIQYVRGQQAGVQAKYQAAQSFLNQQGGGTVNYPQFEARWNQAYSPDVMMVKAMPNPADQQAYLAQLKQQGKLGDWMQHYQQMQSMGAW